MLLDHPSSKQEVKEQGKGSLLFRVHPEKPARTADILRDLARRPGVLFLCRQSLPDGEHKKRRGNCCDQSCASTLH
jgi:hypothetical protein